MTRVLSRERFSGCLVGQCLGDALGFPVEGAPPEDCEQYLREEFTAIQRAPSFPAPGVVWAGQYTDDSQLAREMMQSFSASRGWDPQDYANRIAAIFRERRIVGQGSATRAAADRLNQGVPWTEAGEPAPSAGNGTAMRAAPVGLLFADDLPELARVAREQSAITHADPRCAAGAIAIAAATAMAAQAGETQHRGAIKAPEFVGELSEAVRAGNAGLAADILRLSEWVVMDPCEAAPEIARCGGPDFDDGWKWISPFVVPSVLWSLYSYLRSPMDFWETIRTSIAAGGDVDTTAAMAGALSGAYLGLDGLPRAVARYVTDRGTWGFGELVDLAHRCHAIKSAKSA